ncbi:MAG: alpha-ketoacid dehydrogenase subunit beta [Halanaerobium sp.]|nr:alpha-ketoacid dehydrogenase subunit beta [Halanaerobium sp.]
MTEKITYSDAICRALEEEMAKDPTIFTYGEDIAQQGGIFGQYKGLIGKFDDRVIDTPISEEVIYGSAVGAALAGCRPVVEYHFADFIFTGITAIVNQIMKIRYMSGGQRSLPIILRGPDGRATAAAAQHSQSIETIFMHVPGIKVVIPATPFDVYGLYKTALNHDDPVIVFEHKQLYGIKGEVPKEEVYIPFGKADIKREGKDVTIVTTGRMVHESMKAAIELAEEGIDCEIIDLRTLIPWDREAVINSVKKTGRLVTVHETWRRAGWGSEIASVVQEEAFDYLDAPIRRVGAYNVPDPFTPEQENFVMPDKDNVVDEVRKFVI